MSFSDIRAARATRGPKSFVVTVPSSAVSSTSLEERTSKPQNQTLPAEYVPGNFQDEASLTAANHVRDEPEAPAVSIPAGCYSQLPPFLTIRRTKERGRGLWTNASVSAGTVLYAVKPHIHTLSRSQLDLYCTNCCAPQSPTGLKKCTKCKTIYYCSTACQNADWPLHKFECGALQKWAASASAETEGGRKYSVPPEAVRSLARIIWKRKKLGSDSVWWKEINEMQSKREDLAQSMVDTQVHLAHAVVRYMGISGQEELQTHDISSISELVELISKFTLNSFSLTTPSLSPIGVTVAPLAGLVNHSCDPNVAVVFPRSSKREPELQIVAIQDIPANSELFNSYIDVTLPITQRQKVLKETYNFTCACNVCSPEHLVEDWRERMWCPNSCGGTCPIPVTEDTVRCPKCCSSANVKDTLDLVQAGQEALDKVTSIQSSEPETALRLIQNMVPLLGARLLPSAHPLLALIRLGQSLLIAKLAKDSSSVVLEPAIQYTMVYVKGISTILRPGHPVRAVAIAELGKLLAVDEPTTDSTSSSDADAFPGNTTSIPALVMGGLEIQVPKGPTRLQRAVEVLQQAYRELTIAFGKANEGGEVGRSVRDMLVSLEKELSVWRNGIRNTLEDTMAEMKGKDGSAH